MSSGHSPGVDDASGRTSVVRPPVLTIEVIAGACSFGDWSFGAVRGGGPAGRGGVPGGGVEGGGVEGGGTGRG
ncbi:hypothetical protein, partial [Gordonia terrae]